MADELHESKLARWAKSGTVGTDPIPAATVIPIRDGRDGVEVLMLRRNSKIAFGGMWVFPGGRVDPGDWETAEAGDDLHASRCAAVREAQEEAGLEIASEALLPLSHWTPPPITPRRYLTWFFLAPAPSGEVVIDGGEIHEHMWMSTAQAFARRDAGDIEIAPPTWVTLHTLSAWQSVGQTLEAVRNIEPERFETHIAIEDGGPTALWHGDAGWPTSDASAPGPRHRLRMHKSGWFYERTA